MIGIRIKNLRKENGWNQTELGKKIGVGRTTITEYEAGRIIPPFEKIQALANVFGVPVSELTGAETPKEENDLIKQLDRIISDLKNVDHSTTIDGMNATIEQKSVAASQLESVKKVIQYMNNLNKGEQPESK